MFKNYYELTKPGIIYGNSLPAAAGFLLASKENFDLKLFFVMLVGLALVIASGCVFNNIYDSKIDVEMERTKNRALVTGKISRQNAIIFGSILLILGITTFIVFSPAWRLYFSLFTALLGFAVYVFFYTPLKHKTVYATLIGSIAGATPPVVGYTAVSNNFDLGALLLFIALVFWQMPHFYAIAIRRLKDYQAAGIPVLPAVKGIHTTKINIIFYIVAFIVAASLLTFFRFTGYTFFIAIVLLGLGWLGLALKGFKKDIDDKLWAKKVFFFSLYVLLAFSVLLSLDSVLV